jgi:hypothetical protein
MHDESYLGVPFSARYVLAHVYPETYNKTRIYTHAHTPIHDAVPFRCFLFGRICIDARTHTHITRREPTHMNIHKIHDAVLFGCFLLGEILTIKGAIGGMLIVGAALVASGIFKKNPSEPTPKNA